MSSVSEFLLCVEQQYTPALVFPRQVKQMKNLKWHRHMISNALHMRQLKWQKKNIKPA